MSLIHSAAHGFLASDRIYFGNIEPADTGIDESAIYYVLAAGLTADDFAFSETDGGAAVTLAFDITDGIVSKAPVYTAITDPSDPQAPPVVLAKPTGLTLASATSVNADGEDITRLDISLVQPTDALLRYTVVTVDNSVGNGVQVTIPLGRTTATIWGVLANTLHSATAESFDKFGNRSGETAATTHTTSQGAGASAGPDGDITVDAAGDAGTANTHARHLHGHKITTYTGTPTTVDATAGSAGTSGTAPARGDHRHPGHDPVTVGTGLDVTAQLVELDLSEVAAGGELGGFMDAPTVDAIHSGSAHHTRLHVVTDVADHTFPGGATTYLDGTGAFSTPAGTAVSTPAGVIVMYAGSAAPSDWLLCDGASLLRASYAALFTAIGTTYGAADGTHFNVPDLRQRFPLGKAASGTGATLGDTGGAIDHLHTGPSHTHSTPAHAHTLSAHTHTGPSHTHTTPTHAHTLSAHTHTGPSHTHTGPSHTHTGPSHTHSTPTHAHTLSAHTHTGPSHTHTGPSHTHTSAAHTHGVDHDHTGPSHSHNMSAMGTGITQPAATGTATRPASNHTHAFTTTSDGTGHTSGALNGLGNPMVVTDSTTPGATGADGTQATGAAGTGATAGPNSDTTDTSGSGTSGAAGTGATGADGTAATGASGTGASGAPSADTTDTSGNGTSGASGTAVTGAPSSDTTDSSGSGTSGAAGTGNTGTNNPPFVVVNFIIKT